MKKILSLLFLMAMSLGYAQPSASPSDPPARNAWDVLSMYGDSYSSQSGVQFLTFGGSTINADYTPAGGNASKYYTGHSYSGIQVNTAGSLDVSGMTHLHFDVWSPNFNSMAIKLESSTGTARELGVTGTIVPSSSTRSQWISVDLELSTYNTGNILTNLKYIVPVTFGQNATLYIDNIYFYRPATTSQPPTFGTFTVPAKLVGAADFTITPPTSNSNGAFSYTSSNTAVATIVSGNQIRIIGAGTSVITASQAASGSLVAGSTTAVLNVTYPALTTDAPAAPTRNAWDVISLYSSAYTDLAGTNWYPNWGQSTTFADYTPNVNETKQYQNLNYQGVQLTANTNISAMTTMHVDIYSPDATALDFRLIAGGERNKTLTLTPGQWNSFDIPLSDYVGANLTVLNQLKFQTNPFGSLRNVVYLDNVYFYRAATALPSPTITNFSVPAKSVGSSSFALTDPTSNSGGAFSYTSSNTNVATVSGSTVTVVGIGSTTITATQAGTSSYGSGVITAVFDVTPGAAPTPTVASSNVISLYSNAYTNVTNIDWNPNWGQSTQVSELSIDGNTTRKYSSMNYQGVQFAAPINASAMVSLHIDVWTSNCTSFEVFLINQPAPEQKVTLTPTANGWNSFDILLSQYTNINKANIGQMKFVATPSGTSVVFVDNIYFSDVPLTVPPILSGFAVATKAVGAAPFTITPPTSGSTGAFTYTSSDTDVATISGSTVTVVGIGTTTITATQAASGSYTSGSITANFVVTAPPPTAPVTGAPNPPTRNAWDVKSIFSGAYANVAIAELPTSWSQTAIAPFSVQSIAGNDTWKFGGEFLGMQINNPGVDLSEMTMMHIDYWTPDPNLLILKIVNTINTGDAITILEDPTQIGSWRSRDIPMSSFGGSINKSKITQLLIDPQSGGSTVFVDNFYFYRPATLAPSPTITNFNIAPKVVGNPDFPIGRPTTNSNGSFTYTSSNTAVATIVNGNKIHVVGAGTTTITATQAASGNYASGFTTAALVVSYPNPTAPATFPTKSASRVISIFSDVYTNVAGTGFFQQWGSATNGSTIQNSGNQIQKYTNLSYVGTQFATPINASAMDMLHLDIWTPDCTAFKVFLISNGENAVTLNPTLSGWNSFDIDLSLYSEAGRNLAAIQQFKFERDGSGTKTVYLDNIYFFNNTTKVQTSQDGATLATLNTDIMANAIVGATDYRFKVVANGETDVIERGNRRFFNLSMLPNGASYNTAYTISVATKYNNKWFNYGASAIVTTPAAPTTKVQASQCGETLASNNAAILADNVQFATAYRFRVFVNGDSYEINPTGTRRYFNLTALPIAVTAGTTYAISVAAQFNGAWGQDIVYGTECNVTTPGTAENSRQATESTSIETKDFSLAAYPNPSNGAFKFQINGSNNETISVLVFDMTGRQIENKVVKSNEIENISLGQNYATGIYNVVVSQGMNTKTVRLVKN